MPLPELPAESQKACEASNGAGQKKEAKRTRGRGENETYYFLALVTQNDIIDGSFTPSIVLCKSFTTSDSRTGYVAVKTVNGKLVRNQPKLLVTEITGHDDLLNFLSVYQTQDGYKQTHYHPEGALCWFTANRYGEPLGSVIYARKVPIKKLMWDFKAKRQFRMRKLDQKASLKEALYRHPTEESYLPSNQKPVLNHKNR